MKDVTIHVILSEAKNLLRDGIVINNSSKGYNSLRITVYRSRITNYGSRIGRARWGASGVLHPQSAIAGLNSRSEALTFLRPAQASDDEGWVLRNLKLLNPVRPGREQRQATGECAAGKPGWSQLLEYRLEEQVEDQVHGLINERKE